MASATQAPVYHQQHNMFGGQQDYYQSFASFAPMPAEPPLPAGLGPSLLDKSEQHGLSDFFDSVASGKEIGSAFLMDPTLTNFFDPQLPDPMLWGWHDQAALASQYSETNLPGPFTHHISPPPPQQLSTKEPARPPTKSHNKRKSIVQPDVSIDPYNVNPFQLENTLRDSMRAALPEKRLQLPKQDSIISSGSGGLAWGSDPHFNQAGYKGPDVQSNVDYDVAHRLSTLISKTNAPSIDTTATPSPVEFKPEPNSADDTEDESRESSSSSATRQRSSSAKKPRKKSKPSLHRGRSGNESHDGLSSPRIKKHCSGSAKGSGGKRDNLSEAQKRENHIQSEQKRRNLIRTGFEDLCTLVPELRGGGYSKSAVLIHAASYLEQVEEGNEKLRRMVGQLEGRY